MAPHKNDPRRATNATRAKDEAGQAVHPNDTPPTPYLAQVCDHILADAADLLDEDAALELDEDAYLDALDDAVAFLLEEVHG
jgi:hypothetical protein